LGAVADPGTNEIAEQKKEPVGQHGGKKHWNLTDLSVLCTEGRCQVNMGTIPVLLTAPTWDGIKYVAAAPSGLSKQRRNSFLKEASRRFQAQMIKHTASNNWAILRRNEGGARSGTKGRTLEAQQRSKSH
jgi:hypothetical protein